MLKSNRRPRALAHVDRIWTLDEFAKQNSISIMTLYRVLRRGDGPKITRISPRRIGIRESDGAAWQAARVQVRA